MIDKVQIITHYVNTLSKELDEKRFERHDVILHPLK